MQFQGRELRIGDKLLSKRHGAIEVVAMYRTWFSAVLENGSIRDWEYTGAYAHVDDPTVDATWPDAAPDANPAPDREAEYRRIWIERACVAFDGDAPNANPTDSAVYAFDAADAFIAELRKRDQEGK